MRIFSLFAVLALLCAACGTRGPLTLPPGPPTPALLDKPSTTTPPATPVNAVPADHNNKAKPTSAP